MFPEGPGTLEAIACASVSCRKNKLFRIPSGVSMRMNELVNLIVQKTGISQEQAQKAAQAAIEFIKGKLPPAISSQVDAVLAGNMSGVAGAAGDIAKGKFGGFGG
jgi:hypothetical protein